jgi:hypothetical protein
MCIRDRPGSVYTEEFYKKGYQYFWYVTDDEKIDVTYVVYRLLMEA